MKHKSSAGAARSGCDPRDGERNNVIKWLAHLRTINRHKRLVLQYCFRAGLYRQGLLHDLSKYSPVEFRVGARYFQGNRSPNDAERRARGYSSAWLHHKGRNKHHLEYWIDYAAEEPHSMTGMEMPARYVVEMFCDRIAASRVYRGAAYTDADPFDYYWRSRTHYIIHPNTRALLEKLLRTLKEDGEDAAFALIRRDVLHNEKRRRPGAGRAV